MLRSQHHRQVGNRYREMITIVAAIYGKGTVLPSLIIHKGTGIDNSNVRSELQLVEVQCVEKSMFPRYLNNEMDHSCTKESQQVKVCFYRL